MTLGDYFLLVLRSPTAQQGLGWEQLNIFGSGLPAFATGAPTLPYEAPSTCGPARAERRVPLRSTSRRRFPSGFLYDAGTSRLVERPNACVPGTEIGDPTETVLADGRRTLRWTVDTVVGRDYRLCFTARPGLILGPQAASLDVTPDRAST